MEKEILLEKEIKGASLSKVTLPKDVEDAIAETNWSDAFVKTLRTAGTEEKVYTVALTLNKDPKNNKDLQAYINAWKPKGDNAPDGKFIVERGQKFYIKPNKDSGISTTSDFWSNLKGLFKLDFKKVFNLGFFDFNQVPPVTVVSSTDESRVYKEGAFEPVSTVGEALLLSAEGINEFEEAFKKGQNRVRYNIMSDFTIEKVEVDAKEVGQTGNAFEEVVKRFIESKVGDSLTLNETQIIKLIPVVSHLIKSDLNNIEKNPVLNFLFSRENIKNGILNDVNKANELVKALINGLNNDTVTIQRLRSPNYVAYKKDLWGRPADEIKNILSIYDWLATNAQYASDIGRESGFKALQEVSPKVKNIVQNGDIDYSKLLSAIIYENGDALAGKIRPYSEMSDLFDNIQLNPEKPEDTIFKDTDKTKKGKTKKSTPRTKPTGATAATGRNLVDADTLSNNLDIDINKLINSLTDGRNGEKNKADLLQFLKQKGVKLK